MDTEKLDISVVIITYNEEKNIRRCLEHLGWAREVVVVDSYSTDKTVEIAREYTDKVVLHAFEGYVKQKNYALDKATVNWVLSVDADEVVTPELLSQIREVWSKDKEMYAGFTVNRRSRFCGKWIGHCGWYPDRKLRLFNRQKGRWTGDRLHEKIQLEGKIKNLKADLLHYTYENLADIVERTQRYSAIFAEAKFERGKRTSILDLLFRPVFKFFKAYVLKQGFRDGSHGLILCICAAHSVFMKYAKLWELVRRRSERQGRKTES